MTTAELLQAYREAVVNAGNGRPSPAAQRKIDQAARAYRKSLTV